MNRIRKLLTLYLTASGIALHLLLLAMWFTAPQLIWRAEQRALDWLQANGVAPAAAGAPATQGAAADLRAAMPPWQPAQNDGMAPGQFRVAGASFDQLNQALSQLQDGDTLDIGPGVYGEGLILKADRVTIRGHGHVVFDNAAVKGKGALLIQGNHTRIENIECRNVRVADRNGACIRLEGSDLTLDGVYFHDSQQGVLTGRTPGQVNIHASRFEMLGKGGRAHGIYIGGGQLHIRDSLFLSAIDQGHEIKSRAETTLIENTVVASLGGNDSRLLDISNGGRLTVRNSVLAEGPASVNSDIIGFALEKHAHPEHRIELTNNIFLLEGPGRNRLLHQGQGTPAPIFQGNLIIGHSDGEYAGMNILLSNRQEAGLPPYPALPPLPQQ